MTTVIKAESISKQYLISHQKKANYSTFSESLSGLGQRLVNRVRHPLSSPSKSEIEVFSALTDINFEIQQGDRVGIIGRNGAGKSTLLKILSRITEPTTGTVGVKGRVASLLEVGTGFHPELTGRENIFLNGAILGMTKRDIRARFDEIVAFSEVEKFLDTPVKRYSSGMRVRLAFSIAAHLEPEILIIDEVLAVGDVQFQKKCISRMKDVGREGKTLLFVSHNLSQVHKLCSQGIYLCDGKIKSFSGIDQVAAQYHKNQDSIEQSGFKSIRDANTVLRNINVYSQNHEISSRPIFDEELIFEVEFELLKNLTAASFHLGIDSALGVRVTTIDSKFNNFELNKLSSGLYNLRISTKGVLLMPGKYYISKFMIGDRTSEISTFVQEICSFSIDEYTNCAPVSTGLLLGKANWSISGGG